MLHPLNKFFDKVFILSIKRNNHRLNNFLKNHPDLEFEVFEGIDGHSLYPSLKFVSEFPRPFFEDNKLIYDRCRRWNKGQLGCALTHSAVQKEILKRKLGKTLILEDDAQLIRANIEYFEKGAKELPSDWDLFYLGYSAPSKWAECDYLKVFVKLKHLIKPVHTEGMSSGTFTKNYFQSSHSKHLKEAGVYVGAHAYALSYLGAEKIVSLDTPLQHGFDIALMYAIYHKLVTGIALKRQLFIPNSCYETSLIN